MEEESGNKPSGTQKADEPKETNKARPKAKTCTTQPEFGSTIDSGASSGTAVIVYDVEHLATFSTTAIESVNGKHQISQHIATTSNNNNNDGSVAQQVADAAPQSTTSNATTTRVALRKLFELEKLSGIWTQRMQIELRDHLMLIVDCETNCVVEKFHRDSVSQPEAFNQYNDIYSNIVVFIIKQQVSSAVSEQQEEEEEDNECSDGIESAKSELHIFQCVSHKAHQLVDHIKEWKSAASNNRMCATNQPNTGSGSSLVMSSSSSGASSSGSKASPPVSESSQPDKATGSSPTNHLSPLSSENSPLDASKSLNGTTSASKPALTVSNSSQDTDTTPIVNVNVKETVQVFNQIAALRGKSTLISPTSQQQPLITATTPSTTRLSSVERISPSSNKPIKELFRPNNNTSTTNNLSSSSPSSSSKPYKRRTIRAILAPPSETNLETGRHQLTCSSSSSTSSNEQQKVAATAVASGFPMAIGSHQARHPTSATYLSHRDNAEQHSSRTSMLEGQASHLKGASKQKQAPQNSSTWHSSELQQSQSPLEQVTSNESYVSVLNHCFDDIELFIIRLQHAMTILHQHQHPPPIDAAPLRKHSSKRSGLAQVKGISSKVVPEPNDLLNGNGMGTNIGPVEDDFYEIFSKFKLAFNLLAKLKGCIHEPNAPELVHFLFTPLNIIVEAAQNAKPPIDPAAVGIPYLNQDALDLLSNCCTSKESDMWNSLGPNWTQTIDVSILKASRLPSSFQPIFSDGWAPVIGELELIGLVMPKKKLLKSESPAQFPARLRGKSTHYTPEEFVSHQSAAEFYNTNDIINKQDKQAATKKLGPSNNTKLASSSSGRGQPRSSSKRSQLYSSLQDGLNPKYPAPTNHEHRRQKEQSSQSQSYSKSNWRQSSKQNSHLPDCPDGRTYYQPDYRTGVEGEIGEDSCYPVNPEMYSVYQGDSQNMRSEAYVNSGSITSDCPIDDQLEATLIELGPAQTEWFYELQDRGAMIVKALFSRDANNEKELTVRRGEILEILDDSRKWWRARNIELQTGHVPHTIVALLQESRNTRELIHNSFPST